MEILKLRLFLNTRLDPIPKFWDVGNGNGNGKSQKPLRYPAVNPRVEHRKEDPASDPSETLIRAMSRSDYWPLYNYVRVNNRAASLHLRLLQPGPRDLEEIRSGLEIALPETKLRVGSD